MKAEISKDRVLEAASKCPTAKETLKVLFPEFFEEDKTYRIGQFFTVDGDLCILAQTGFGKCSLISIKDGNRYSDAITVESVTNITKHEFDLIKCLEKGVKEVENPFTKK